MGSCCSNGTTVRENSAKSTVTDVTPPSNNVQETALPAPKTAGARSSLACVSSFLSVGSLIVTVDVNV